MVLRIMESVEYHKMKKLEDSNWWYQARKELMRDLIRKYRPNPQYVLDIGCGSGLVLDSLKNIPKRIGVENNPEAINYAKEKNITIFSTIQEAPAEADVILLMDVLEHVEDDQKMLEQSLSKLRKNGIVIITVPAFDWLWSQHDKLVHHQRRYSKKQLENCIKKAGAETIYSSYWNFSFFIPTVIKKKIKTKKNVESDLQEVSNWLNHIMLKIMLFENKISMKFSLPIGSSVFAIIRKK